MQIIHALLSGKSRELNSSIPIWNVINSNNQGQIFVFILQDESVFSFCNSLIGSLRNHDGDAEDNVDQKMNLYFTYESRGTLKSFTLFIIVKTITKVKLKHSDKFEI